MIRVPVTNFSSSAASEPLFVEFTLQSLPKNCRPVIDLLTRERVSIEYWLEVAVSFLSSIYLTLFTLFNRALTNSLVDVPPNRSP